jgi:hypothetical protein
MINSVNNQIGSKRSLNMYYDARDRSVSTTLANGFELVTWRRREAALRYLYEGARVRDDPNAMQDG